MPAISPLPLAECAVGLTPNEKLHAAVPGPGDPSIRVLWEENEKFGISNEVEFSDVRLGVGCEGGGTTSGPHDLLDISGPTLGQQSFALFGMLQIKSKSMSVYVSMYACIYAYTYT